MASIAQQYIFINRDYDYFTEWATKKGLTGYFNNRKKNNYNLLMMKYKKDRTETLKNFYNSQRKSANVRLERLFNEGLAQQELEKGSAKLLNLTEKDVLSEINSADLRSIAKKNNKQFIDNINYNINKNIDKLYDDYSKYQQLYYDINNSTGIKSISEINYKTIQMRALKPENGVVQNFPIDTFNKNLNKVVVDLVAKETINQLAKAMKESGEKIEVDIEEIPISSFDIGQSRNGFSINMRKGNNEIPISISANVEQFKNIRKASTIPSFNSNMQEIGTINDLIESELYDAGNSNVKRAYVYNMLHYADKMPNQVQEFTESLIATYADKIIAGTGFPIHPDSMVMIGGKAINIYDIIYPIVNMQNKENSYIYANIDIMKAGNRDAREAIEAYKNSKLMARANIMQYINTKLI